MGETGILLNLVKQWRPQLLFRMIHAKPPRKTAVQAKNEIGDAPW